METKSGLPLGIMECEFSETEVEMPLGSRLFLYTDGVTEAVDSSLTEYGSTRIRDHVAGQTASVKSLLNDVSKFTSGYPASDDVTAAMIAATA